MSKSPFSRRSEPTTPGQQPAPATSQPSRTIAPEGWFPDPLERFEGRFFDGEQWTNQVSDDGFQREDPDWQTARPKPAFAGADRRGSYDRRQIKIKVDVERRKGDRRDY